MTVSVIIPAFNAEKYIEKCIHSVLAQEYGHMEIICVDDRSSDNTWSILESCREKNPSIMLLRNDNNKGACFARNRGLKIATGEYIQFLDADDVLLPRKIAHQIKLVSESAPAPDLIAGNYSWVNNGKKIIPALFTFNVWEDLLKGTLGNTCSNLWKKKSLDNVAGWEENAFSSQETDLMFRMLKENAAVVYDTEPLTVIYQRKSGSISSSNPSETYQRYLEIRIQIMEYLRTTGNLTVQITETFNKIIFNTVRILYSHNQELALEYYANLFPSKITLKYLSYSSAIYKLLFLLAGFRGAEEMARIFKRSK